MRHHTLKSLVPEVCSWWEGAHTRSREIVSKLSSGEDLFTSEKLTLADNIVRETHEQDCLYGRLLAEAKYVGNWKQGVELTQRFVHFRELVVVLACNAVKHLGKLTKDQIEAILSACSGSGSKSLNQIERLRGGVK